MLTVAESSFLFQYLSFFSSIYMFPFHVDRKYGRLKLFRGRKHLLWSTILILQSVHYIHGLIQFVLLVTVRRDQIVLYHLPAQFDGIVIPLLIYPAIIFAIQTKGDELVKVFNELYDYDDGVTTRRPLWKLSLQELLALGLCIIVMAAVVLYGGMVILFDDMAHLPINNTMLRSLKSSGVAITIATLLEVWSICMWLVCVGFFMSLNCLVLSKTECALTKISAFLLRDGNNGSIGDNLIRSGYFGAIQVQLFIQLFNSVNSWFLHGIKMAFITAAILHGYVGIRFGHSNIWIGGFCGFVHACTFIEYCGTFQRAHRLIGMQRQVKEQLAIASQRTRRTCVGNEIRKAVKALHGTGIRVGSFHEMERNSVLVFIDYVERQLVGLLVTF